MIGTLTSDGGIGWIKAALVIFFIVFLAVSFRAVFRRRGHFDRASRIPLSDDPVETREVRSNKGQDDE